MTLRDIENFRLVDGEKLDNTPDDVNAALDDKVDKVAGKQLSTEDYSTAEKNKLSTAEVVTNKSQPNGYPTLDGSGKVPSSQLPAAGLGDMTTAVYDPTAVEGDAFDQDNMVDGVVNKNFTATEKTKLSGIETGAEVNDVIYDGVDTQAVILASSATTLLGELWWANDTKTPYKAITNIASANVWQAIKLNYNETTDTFSISTTQDGETLDLGQEMIVVSKNNDVTGATALNPKVFASFGAVVGDEEFHSVFKVKASDVNQGERFGINTTELPAGGKGKIVTLGLVHGVNTSAWTLNDVLFIDPTTAGDLTNVQPEINAYPVCHVMKVDAIDGILEATSASSNRIDKKQVPVGIERLFFTGDETTPVATTFFEAKVGDQGTIPTATQLVICPDNTITAAVEDTLSDVQTTPGLFAEGLRTGQIEAEVDSAGAQERIYMEAYDADGDGVVIDSGILTEAIGDLGVRPIFTLVTSLMDYESGDPFQQELRGLLTEDFIIATGNRIRFHFLCEKVGTAGGNKTFTLYQGSNHDTHFDQFIEIPSTYLDLTDTDNTYTGKAGQVPVVNANEDGLDFSVSVPGNGFSEQPYTADTTSQTPPPGNGDIRWNNATQLDSTEIFIPNTNSDGIDTGNLLLTLMQVGSIIALSEKTDTSNFQSWVVTSITDNTTYITYGVTLRGGAEEFSMNEKMEAFYFFSPIEPTGNLNAWKAPVQLASTANVVRSGEQTIDGVLTTGSRVLLKNQTIATENGIYTTGTTPWVRTIDADNSPALIASTTKVMSGTANVNRIFVNTNMNISLGVTAITYVDMSVIASDDLKADLAGATITTASVNGVTLNSTGSATKSLKENGTYVEDSGGGGGITEVFDIYMSANYTLTNTATILPFNTALINENSNFNTGTFKFVAPSDGNYFFNFSLQITGATSDSANLNYIFKNGAEYSRYFINTSVSYGRTDWARFIILTTGDTIEIRSKDSSGIINGTSTYSRFSGYKLN